jgi:hypothetical protein
MFRRLFPALWALAVVAPSLATARTARAAGTLYTLTDGQLSGFFGTATASGTYTTGLATNTSNIVVDEGSCSYDFTAPYPDFVLPSEIPQPPCIIVGGCPPPTPTYAIFTIGVFSGSGRLVALGLEDSGEDFGGSGILTATPISGSPPSIPEPCSMTIVLSALAGLGLIACGRSRWPYPATTFATCSGVRSTRAS